MDLSDQERRLRRELAILEARAKPTARSRQIERIRKLQGKIIRTKYGKIIRVGKSVGRGISKTYSQTQKHATRMDKQKKKQKGFFDFGY